MSADEQRKLAAIMFTDMVGYSALSQRDEKLAQELLEEHREILRKIFPRFNGTEIKTIGDAFLIEFHSALEAAQCAIEIQRTLAKRNHDVTADRRIELRIGVHIGDVVHRGGDVYGDGVNIASRIEPLAGAGGICVSMDVERQIRNALEARFEKLAPTELKNISVAMDLFRIVLPWEQKSEVRGPKSEVGKRAEVPTNRRFALIGGLALLVLLGIGWWWTTEPRRSPTSSATSSTATADQKSIAVLPFVNLSADKNDEYLSDGMTEELLNALSKVQRLRVPGRSSSFAFKGDNAQDIFRKVGEQLHVNAVLEGSVRKAGEKLRITAQLINVADGFHLWSETYDGDMKDILAVQSDVAKRVVQALQVQLGVDEARALAKKPTENPEAHRLYLLGRFHFAKFTRAGWTNAIHYFEQALQVDPNFALAYCGLADTYGWAGGQLMPGREAWAKEMELAQKALALDPNLAEAHLSVATAFYSALSPHTSEKKLDRAVELNPKLALAYDQYGWTFSEMGRHDEAIAAEKKALELDPLNTFLNTDLAFFLYWARRYDDATTQIRKTLELDPNNGFAHSILGWCLIWKGFKAEARAEFQKATTLDDLPWYVSSVGYASAVLGDRAKAEKILRELDEIAKQRYVSPANRAAVYLGLGDKEKALDWIEKAWEDRDPIFWWIQDQLYDSVRNEPRFQEVLRKTGAPMR
ncbi:MAG TPA: adenylate/guanylate cyclase domain-containing protein [Pyrinomonadaceae bacterium]|nr:adenylate/guanylate cyclase domain-containing protein [Pyrinomonadaceae bacterium]